MLIISGAALTRNSVYLLIGDLLFQYCMQIGLLMWDMLLLACAVPGRHLDGRRRHSLRPLCSVWVFINHWEKLAQYIPPPFLCSIIGGTELKLEVANADLNATNLVCF